MPAVDLSTHPVVATRIKPQARVFAESRGVECVEIDLDALREGAPVDLRLFG